MQLFLKSGLNNTWLLGLFSVKLACGLLYGFIYSRPQYIATSDTWQIFFASLEEYKILLNDPALFFKTWFGNPGHLEYLNFFESRHSYWNVFKEILLIKLEALMNLFTGGRYYINVALYSFISFSGVVIFYRAIRNIYPGSRLIQLFACFLLPSFLFWTSGMYKDGILFLLVSTIIFQMEQWYGDKNMKRPLVMVVMLIFIFLLRTYVALLFIPALTAWFLSCSYPRKITVVFLSVYLFLAIFILAAPFIHPSLDIPRLLASWQHAFLKLPSRTSIPVRELEPSVSGIIKNLPQALNIGFLRPYLWENKGIQNIPHAFEVILYCIMFFYFILQKKTQSREQMLFLYFCIFFSCSAWLFIGYTVNITGALVRYKSIFLPVVIAPLVCCIKFRR